MRKQITKMERARVLQMLAEGVDRNEIAATIGLSRAQVAAIAAHVKMGTYKHSDARISDTFSSQSSIRSVQFKESTEEVSFSLTTINNDGVLLGEDAYSGVDVHWRPWPESGTANPHMLIIGGSGYGKTYTISCLIAELALQGIPSVIFDYAQGFSQTALDPNLDKEIPIASLDISRNGVAVNPLNIHESDPLGPVNAAQRIADTFARVYPRIGVQQHTLLRQAAIDVFADAGIYPESPASWTNKPPPFAALYTLLKTSGNDSNHPQRKIAASVASHISTLFVFNTFRAEGEKLDWPNLLRNGNRILVLCLNGLEYSVERAITEFLLWSLFGRVETLGPGSLRCFVVLDEAHKLSFTPGSPVERLLREGRKFGIGVILSSQQPEDFSTTLSKSLKSWIVEINDTESHQFENSFIS
jgi:DNA phosphorothioation-dependent restriction protein DptH